MSHDPILDSVEEKIAAHGVAILGIFADPGRGLPGFSYSIGMQDRGWPELILSGVDPRYAQMILNRGIAALKERGEPPAEGEIVEDWLGEGYRCRFRELSPAEVATNLRIACARSREIGRDPPAAFQLVYQDPERRWPEDPGYSCPMALMLAQGDEETMQ